MEAVKNRSCKAILIEITIALFVLIFIGQFCVSGFAYAQDTSGKQIQSRDQTAIQAQTGEALYVIGSLDMLSVSFWQQPDLNRDVRVDESGLISLPVIGDIKAAGLTPNELSKRIVQQMSIYNTPVSQATVTVTEFNSRSVVVAGRVLTPGSRRYEKIPDVWQVILDAGGPMSDADLSRVSIIRKEGGKSDVINVDLYKIIQSGDLGKAPQLQPGDLVNIPQSSYGNNITMALPSQPRFEGKNIFFVFGQVIEQGPRNLEEGMDVLDGIALARGFTPDADLKHVKVIMKDARYSNIVKLNLEKYMSSGQPPRIMLHPEDAIIVPTRHSFFQTAMNNLNTILPALGTTATLVLVIREIQRNP
jgi:polysaccharide biosynthesis/export protein